MTVLRVVLLLIALASAFGTSPGTDAEIVAAFEAKLAKLGVQLEEVLAFSENDLDELLKEELKLKVLARHVVRKWLEDKGRSAPPAVEGPPGGGVVEWLLQLVVASIIGGAIIIADRKYRLTSGRAAERALSKISTATALPDPVPAPPAPASSMSREEAACVLQRFYRRYCKEEFDISEASTSSPCIVAQSLLPDLREQVEGEEARLRGSTESSEAMCWEEVMCMARDSLSVVRAAEVYHTEQQWHIIRIEMEERGRAEEEEEEDRGQLEAWFGTAMLEAFLNEEGAGREGVVAEEDDERDDLATAALTDMLTAKKSEHARVEQEESICEVVEYEEEGRGLILDGYESGAVALAEWASRDREIAAQLTSTLSDGFDVAELIATESSEYLKILADEEASRFAAKISEGVRLENMRAAELAALEEGEAEVRAAYEKEHRQKLRYLRIVCTQLQDEYSERCSVYSTEKEDRSQLFCQHLRDHKHLKRKEALVNECQEKIQEMDTDEDGERAALQEAFQTCLVALRRVSQFIAACQMDELSSRRDIEKAEGMALKKIGDLMAHKGGKLFASLVDKEEVSRRAEIIKEELERRSALRGFIAPVKKEAQENARRRTAMIKKEGEGREAIKEAELQDWKRVKAVIDSFHNKIKRRKDALRKCVADEKRVREQLRLEARGEHQTIIAMEKKARKKAQQEHFLRVDREERTAAEKEREASQLHERAARAQRMNELASRAVARRKPAPKETPRTRSIPRNPSEAPRSARAPAPRARAGSAAPRSGKIVIMPLPEEGKAPRRSTSARGPHKAKLASSGEIKAPEWTDEVVVMHPNPTSARVQSASCLLDDVVSPPSAHRSADNGAPPPCKPAPLERCDLLASQVLQDIPKPTSYTPGKVVRAARDLDAMCKTGDLGTVREEEGRGGDTQLSVAWESGVVGDVPRDAVMADSSPSMASSSLARTTSSLFREMGEDSEEPARSLSMSAKEIPQGNSSPQEREPITHRMEPESDEEKEAQEDGLSTHDHLTEQTDDTAKAGLRDAPLTSGVFQTQDDDDASLASKDEDAISDDDDQVLSAAAARLRLGRLGSSALHEAEETETDGEDDCHTDSLDREYEELVTKRKGLRVVPEGAPDATAERLCDGVEDFERMMMHVAGYGELPQSTLSPNGLEMGSMVMEEAPVGSPTAQCS
eukprot:Sspe_Gene.6969::Locus_2334_Transcript_1_1_Confidence_1.000_Length_3580::g.6969::m.6969